MTAGPKVLYIEGLETLSRQFRNLSEDTLRKELRGEFIQIAKVVTTTAKASPLLPVVSGRLQKSIKPSVTQGNIGVRMGTGPRASTKSRVLYAGPIHFGWPDRNIPKRPFLYDAIHRERHTFQRLLEAGMQRAIYKAGLGPGV